MLCPDLLASLSEALLQRYPDCLQYVHEGTGVNRCIYVVLTCVSLPVISDVTYMFVCSSYVCFDPWECLPA